MHQQGNYPPGEGDDGVQVYAMNIDLLISLARSRATRNHKAPSFMENMRHKRIGTTQYLLLKKGELDQWRSQDLIW
jgi:hypothetical protein